MTASRMLPTDDDALLTWLTRRVEALHKGGRPGGRLRRLPAGERAAVALFVFDGMVMNGGLSSCFDQAEWVVGDAIAALAGGGEAETAALVERAYAAFTGGEWPADDGQSLSQAYWDHRFEHDLLPVVRRAAAVASAGSA